MMKKMGIILIVLVLLLSGCNSKTEEPEIVLIVDGEEITAEDLLDSIDKELENTGMFGLEELTATKEPVEIETSGLSEDEYRIRSVFEGAMFTIEDPNNGEKIFSDDAIFCSIYDSLILVGDYNKPIKDFNSSLLAEEIREKSDLKLDYCYVPKHKHTVKMMLYGAIENSKYLMFAGDIEISQNINIEWSAVEANNGTNAKEVATLYTEMDNMKLESHISDEKAIYYYSDEEGWFLTRYFGIEDFSTVYLWDYKGSICAVIVPGEHCEENFEYCSFVKKDI